jgi:hypothetical protein
MSVPRPLEVYLDRNCNKFTVIGMETKQDGIYTIYRDSNYKEYSCKYEAFLDRFTLFNNYDSSSRNN